MPSSPPVNLKNRHFAALLAWMVPGLGHVYQGRTGKGVLYAVCILGLFLTGLWLGNWQIIYWRWLNPLANSEKFQFYYLGQFWAGLVALPALIQGTLQYYDHEPLGWFMAVPDQDKINALYEHTKSVEIGSIYTFVAGLLNILAIYDAFDGPAHVAEEPPATAATATAPSPATAAEPNPTPEVAEAGTTA